MVPACVGVVLIAVFARWGYAIVYTAVGPKTQGEVSDVFCRDQHGPKASHRVCMGDFRESNGSLSPDVSVKGLTVKGEERSTDVRRGQLVTALRPRAATTYVGDVARRQLGAALWDLLFLAISFGMVLRGYGVDVERHRRASIEQTPDAGEERGSDVPVS